MSAGCSFWPSSPSVIGSPVQPGGQGLVSPLEVSRACPGGSGWSAFSGGARSHRESATEKEAEGGKQGAHQKNRAAPKEWKGRGRGAEEEREREESRNRGRETEGCVKRQESEGGGREGREKRERMGGRERGADASPARGNRSAPLFPSRGVSINST